MDYFTEEHPLITGAIVLVLGILYLFFKLKSGNAFKVNKMKCHWWERYSWRYQVYTWGIIILLIGGGLILIFKGIGLDNQLGIFR
ncbi:hypothetical protein OOZ15_13165 [Galbibacter sp. EGI 63066]|uniref:hypothetical protein n=1 Tax=Galbibacter sp. EGI 63066 TaxID=2993559 RepID=UPI0022487A15|nr:hypothetical protein [Galbibacter sp. EGI 63066]MCX2680897.1 hypothetical protein [Galbibacter sp. EGI 63066]